MVGRLLAFGAGVAAARGVPLPWGGAGPSAPRSTRHSRTTSSRMRQARFLLPLLLAAAAGCTRTYVANSTGTVGARPGALACVRERAADLGYAVAAAGGDTLVVRGERPRLDDRLRVVLDPARNLLSISAESGRSPVRDRAAGDRMLSDVQVIGQTCGVLLAPEAMLDSVAQPGRQ